MELESFSYKEFLYSMEKEKHREKENKKSDKDESNPKEEPVGRKRVVEIEKMDKDTFLDKLKELPAKAGAIKKRAQLWGRKRKNLFFYKRYLDRVQSGLYQRYADKAYVIENNMKGDPVEILKGEAQEYIREIVENINSLYEEVRGLSRELENKVTAEQCINTIKNYCKDVLDQNIKGEKVDPDKISYKVKLLNATKHKIAKILLRNGEREVYGYTVRNSILKGYPKPNHLIVTLFVENPENPPSQQYISNIFSSADSFELLADSDKKDIFNVSNMTEAILTKTVDGKVMNEIKLSKDNAVNRFKGTKMPNKVDEGKIIDDIWNGIKDSCKELLNQKTYLIDCINVYFDMILRIDKLAVQSIKNMLDFENSERDHNYSRHLNVKHKKDDNYYRPDSDDIVTPYDRKMATQPLKREKKLNNRLNKSKLQSTTRTINKGIGV